MGAFRAKVATANAKIKETREKKFDAEQKTLQNKLTAALNDYNKKKQDVVVATEARTATRVKMTTVRLNSEAATEKKEELNTKAGHATELKSKQSSEVNQKASQDASDQAASDKETASEAEHKLKEILSVMDERDAKMSQAKLAEQEALKVKESAETAVGTHKAKRDEMVKPEPPPQLDDISADDKFQIDPALMMKKQMAAMGKSLPGETGGSYK